MPAQTIAFIDPKAALGALTPMQAKLVDLGPSPPHTDDDPQEVTPIKANLAPRVGLGPGMPPILGEKHYTQVLDEIWPEFDDPEERTAARLDSLIDEVADEAQRVFTLAQDAWPSMPWYKVPDLERKRWDSEFTAYLRRLNDYRGELRSLEPNSTATSNVYVGLVKRRQGAGPVPDCIMHLYFADQLGILAEHSDQMSKGFVGRMMDGLARADQVIDDAAAEIEQAQRDAKDQITNTQERLIRAAKIAGGVVLGSLVIIVGAVVYGNVRRREPPPQPQPQEPST